MFRLSTKQTLHRVDTGGVVKAAHRQISSSSFSLASVSTQEALSFSIECRSPALWQQSEPNMQSLHKTEENRLER